MEKARSPVYYGAVRRESELSTAGLRTSILLITLALAAVGVMQFSWFNRSAVGEIADAYRDLEATVAQAVSREYQRYAPLMGELRSFHSPERLALASLEDFLERAYAAYGPAGVTPKLLKSVRLVGTNAPFALRTYDPANDRWEDSPGFVDFPSWSPERAAETLKRGDIGLFGTAEGRRYLLSSPSPASPFLLMLELDSEGFFEGYVAPAASVLFADAELSWSEYMSRDPAPVRAGLDIAERRGGPAEHRFDPFRALIGRGSTATFFIPVSADLDPFFALEVERGRQRRPDQAPFRLIPVVSGEGPPIGGRIRLLGVTLPPSSRVGSMERRLAVNWFLGNLLLIGVWFAFVQAVVQRRRLGLMRQREREFVASVTHELRTPLTVIVSAADNLQSGLVKGGRVAEYGKLIAGQSERLGAMIEEVLLYSRVEGKEPEAPTLSPTGPARLEAELRGPLEELARGAGSSLDWDVSELPSTFMGDSAGIGLVVSNLVANAAFHAYEKGSGGAIRVRGKHGASGHLLISVEDDGRGIPRSEASLVFEPFYRDEATRRRREKGTGLGLFLARRKARSLGGELRLESPYRRADGTRAQGCRFTLELPSQEVPDGA